MWRSKPLRRALAKGAKIEPHPFLKCGDWVRVKAGPLEGLEGILVRDKNQSRLVLSVELVQKSVAVEVDAWLVERVPRRNQPALKCSSVLHPWSGKSSVVRFNANSEVGCGC